MPAFLRGATTYDRAVARNTRNACRLTRHRVIFAGREGAKCMNERVPFDSWDTVFASSHLRDGRRAAAPGLASQRQQAQLVMQRFRRMLSESEKLLDGMAGKEPFMFAQWPIQWATCFFLSRYTVGFVNLKPILPGHVLLCPRRVLARFEELNEEEVCDLYLSVQAVGAVMERKHDCDALTISQQDGVSAGQSVAHAHVHLIPRRPGDLPRNDEIYERLMKHDSSWEHRRPTGVDYDEREPRSLAEMMQETQSIRRYIHALTEKS